MQPILSLSEAQELDHKLIKDYGLSEGSLINGAAEAVFEAAGDKIHGRTLVMIGPGNNGSDGLALIPILFCHGIAADVLFLYDKGNAENLMRRAMLPGGVHIAESAAGYDTVIDALFGFSFHGEPDERTKACIASIDEEATVISIDVPSAGLVEADITVTLMAFKDVLYLPSARGRAGRVLLRNPGFPEDELLKSPGGMFLIDDSDSTLKPIKAADYKNTRGHVAIIGGSDRYAGAPRLAARSAFFSGAGLVTIATRSEKVRDENPAVMIQDPGDDLKRFDSIVIGPGWDEGEPEAIGKAIESGRPLVIDADGLRHVPGHRFGWRAVITPHIGEYRRLMAALSLPDGLEDAEALRSSIGKLSRTLECIVVLKSSVVWIADGETILVCDGANPSLGVAGSGDVLSGIIGALEAFGEDPWSAAKDGVLLHQRAGRNAHGRYGFYSAEELIEEVGRSR